MSHRAKILGTIISSYLVACIFVAAGLGLVTSKYEMAIEQSEHTQIQDIANRQLSDLIWVRYADQVTKLARNIAQEKSLEDASRTHELKSLVTSLPDLSQRAAVTSGSIKLLSYDVFNLHGVKIASSRSQSDPNPDRDIEAMLSARKGIERLKILNLTWSKRGRPILTIVHPIGGLRPVGYVAVHADIVHAIVRQDQQMWIGATIRDVSGEKVLQTLKGPGQARPAVDLHHYQLVVTAPDGTPAFSLIIEHNTSNRVQTMQQIRFWSFGALIGILIVVSVASTTLVFFLTQRMAHQGADERV